MIRFYCGSCDGIRLFHELAWCPMCQSWHAFKTLAGLGITSDSQTRICSECGATAPEEAPHDAP